jgi:Protein of unknown function (DUF1524)
LAPGEKKISAPSDVHLEHIMPQTSTKYWEPLNKADTEYSDTVAKWGNLTLLLKKVNVSIKNGAWDIKQHGNGRFDGYNKSDIKMTTDLLDVNEWNWSRRSAVSERLSPHPHPQRLLHHPRRCHATDWRPASRSRPRATIHGERMDHPAGRSSTPTLRRQRQRDLHEDLYAAGGPESTVGTYSRSWMRSSKVRRLIISSATSG